MNRFLIWYHRRRAAHHEAEYCWHKSLGEYAGMNWHISWRDFHMNQIKRLSAPERKLLASGDSPWTGSETARD
jgi:hypothetical protein